jgi:hypothetical protein
MERIAEASAKVPKVFDEKDKRWGWYLARKDSRPKNEIYQPSAAAAAERNDDHDSIRQERPRHQASGVRSAAGGSGSNSRGRTSGHDQHVGHNAPRPVGGIEAARLSQG